MSRTPSRALSRRIPTRRMATATLAALTLAVGLLASSPGTAAEGTSKIRWAGSLTDAKAAADASGKPILIVFGADWCTYCKKLDAETLSNPAIANYINEGFVPVHLDFDQQKWAARILEVKTLPCSVVLAPNADQLGRIVGFENASPYFQKLQAAQQMQRTIMQTSATR